MAMRFNGQVMSFKFDQWIQDGEIDKLMVGA